MSLRVRVRVFTFSILCVMGLWQSWWPASLARQRSNSQFGKVTQGQLRIADAQGNVKGFCPLKNTEVKAEISGFLARVTVTQEFHNPSAEAIEALYIFPLSQRAAVDAMTMLVGGRTIRGVIKRRKEAQQMFAEARAQSRVAALLNQERPNLFTQAVTNIAPNETVKVTISYVETLSYEAGVYEFVFPMTVGPRYTPAGSAASPTMGATYTPKGKRLGHDIKIEVILDSGVPIENITSALHAVTIDRDGDHQAVIRLQDQALIPDRDFVLRYDVSGRRINDAVLAHHDEHGGFFSLILQPPDVVTTQDIAPRELVFVLDTSGSMDGTPINTAKRLIYHALDELYENDTFNLITFAGDTDILFERPVLASRENIAKAKDFLNGRASGGGTEMMKAIRAALEGTDHQDHVRIVCFMTDGFIGNEFEILSEIQKHPKARVFTFGIGDSVNRYLLDKMAEIGGGEHEYVLLGEGKKDNPRVAAKRFYERVRAPLFTDINIDWNGLPVTDVYPRRPADLFSAKPLVITGRYKGGGRGTIRWRGMTRQGVIEREVFVDLPERETRHDVLASLWARTRMDDLMTQDFAGLQRNAPRQEIADEITQLSLDFRLMSQFTSFIAVGDVVIVPGEALKPIPVPLAEPQNVNVAMAGGNASNLALLRPGSITETVTITASGPVSRAETSSISQTVERRSVDSLPLNTQQPSELARVASLPGGT